jgi:Tfp pilus assembly protein PilO
MRVSPRTYPWVTAGLLAALAAGGACLHWSSWRTARENLAALLAQQSQVQSQNTGIRQTLSQAGDPLARAQRLRTRLPVEPDLGAVLESVSERLAELGISGQEVVTSPTTSGTLYGRIPVLLRFRGTVGQAQTVLLHLAGLPRLVRVDRLRIEQVADGGAPVVEIEFSAFTRPAEEVPSWAALK